VEPRRSQALLVSSEEFVAIIGGRTSLHAHSYSVLAGCCLRPMERRILPSSGRLLLPSHPVAGSYVAMAGARGSATPTALATAQRLSDLKSEGGSAQMPFAPMTSDDSRRNVLIGGGPAARVERDGRALRSPSPTGAVTSVMETLTRS